MERSLAVLVVVLSFAVTAPHGGGAASLASCSLHAAKRTAQKDLKAMATVSEDVAQKAALAGFDAGAHPKIVESELGVESGCLVYSFDVAVPGEEGVTEVLVDAGSGDVLSRAHESAAEEAAEKAAERTERRRK